MSNPLDIFAVPADLIVEVEGEMATLLHSEDKWYVSLRPDYALNIGTRPIDVRMVEVINETSYLDESHDGEICSVSGKLSIINERSAFVMKGVEF
jgi:hypothetical protein